MSTKWCSRVKKVACSKADALHALACLRRPRPFVGGLHQTRATAGDDVAVHTTQGRAHLLDLLVNPVPRLGARGAEYRHTIALVPRWTQTGQVIDRGPKSEERVDENASNGFFVGQADGGGRLGRCSAHGWTE